MSSFKKRLFKWVIFVSIIPSILIGAFSYYMIFREIKEDTERSITHINDGIYNMVDTQQRVLNQWLISASDAFDKKLKEYEYISMNYDEMVQVGEYHLPTWYMGEQKITLDYTLVDELIETERLPASIFMLVDNEFVRVSTNVRQKNGERITGSLLEKDSAVYERLINGQSYIGRSNVEGIMHATVYTPIFDVSREKLIGAFVLGRKEQEYELIQNIRRISIGEDGYVMIVDSNADVIVHPELTGQNLNEHDWIQKVITKKNGYIEYSYEGSDKIAYYKYFEPWDWYIISIGFYDDIFRTSHTLFIMLIVIFIASIVISVLIAKKISMEFFKPVDKLMESLKKLKNGDLSARFSSYEDEEFKFLSNAFNSMSYTLSILIGRIINTSNNLNEASDMLLGDFNNSKKSLDNIEDTVNSFMSEMNSAEARSRNFELIKKYSEIRMDLEVIRGLAVEGTEAEESGTEGLLNSIDSIELKLEDIVEHQLDNGIRGRTNYLYVEIQKLKLLLENINNSASSLNEIANEVDNQANLFKIDNDPYQE